MIKLIRPILDRPFFYDTYNLLIGADARAHILVREYIRPRRGDRILDIGCGPGSMVPYLPDCDYLGVDANQSYIESAKKRFSNRGNFVCERVSQHNVKELGEFDIVMAMGLVHHLDDSEAVELFRIGQLALKPGGRMITNDGCYTANQSAIKRYLLSRDRGQYVRTQPEYEALALQCFESVKASLRDDFLRIPYTHIVMECVR